MIIMGFREGLCLQFFRLIFWNNNVFFFVPIYDMKQFKLHVERWFILLSNSLDSVITRRSKRSLSFNNVMFSNRTMARLNGGVVVLDHLNNR